MKLLGRIAHLFDQINEFMGKFASVFTGLLVLVVCLDVFARYFFKTSYIWVLELKTYMFAFIFILGAGYAFKHDKHVRVDVFYAKAGPKGKAWINLIGGILFLIPWCVVVLQVTYRYAIYSYNMNESSGQQGGLPFLYILKFSILLGFILLTLQAISSIFKSIIILNEE